MNLRIITPEREVLNTEVLHVLLPGVLGQMDILPGHARLASLLDSGLITYFKDGKPVEIEVGEGCAEIQDDRVCVLVKSSSKALETSP